MKDTRHEQQYPGSGVLAPTASACINPDLKIILVGRM
jgi:hypothetical protein